MTETTNVAIADPKPATAKKAVSKKAVKKTAKGKKGAKKGVKKASTPRGDSVRLRVFRLLNSKPSGLTNAKIRENLKVDAVASILKAECLRPRNPRIKREDREGERGCVFVLASAGKEALKAGTVDSEAADKAINVEWPNGR